MTKKLHAIPSWRVFQEPRLTVFAVLAGTLVATESAMGDVLKVYWTDRDNGTLSVTDLSGGGTNVLAQNFSRLQDVDLDTSTGILYFADWGPVGLPGNQGSINRVNKDGTGLATVLNTRDAVHQLALDQVIQRIYFTRAVSYDDHEISHVTTGGAGYTILFQGDLAGPGWFPSGLALDSGNNLLYWGDIGVFNLPPNGSVNTMGTNGSAPTQLTSHVVGRGRGYALDQASQTIFFTSHDPNSPGSGGGLFSYDIANNIETQLINDPNTGYWDIEIDPDGQRIWWTDYGRGQIRSAKFDGSDVQVELSNLTNPYGLALEISKAIWVVCDSGVSDSQLAVLDLSTGVLTAVGPLWRGADIEGATRFDGAVLGVSGEVGHPHDLSRLDFCTGTITPGVPVDFSPSRPTQVTGMATDGNGVQWAYLDGFGFATMEADGSFSLDIPYVDPVTRVDGVAASQDGRTLWAMTNDGRILEVDVGTASVALLDDLSAMFDDKIENLARFGNDLVFFVGMGNDVPTMIQLVTYDLVSGVVTIREFDKAVAGDVEAIVFATDCDRGALACDFDGDGVVGVPDLLALLNTWGPCPNCSDCPADVNGDCQVGVPDLLTLLAEWS